MFYTYIVASQRNGTIYIGSTDDLGRRIHHHKIKAQDGFTARHGCDRLVCTRPTTPASPPSPASAA